MQPTRSSEDANYIHYEPQGHQERKHYGATPCKTSTAVTGLSGLSAADCEQADYEWSNDPAKEASHVCVPQFTSEPN